MGRLTTVVEDGGHLATGKLEPKDTRHEPQWGEWVTDGPVWVRYCKYPDCDAEDFQ